MLEAIGQYGDRTYENSDIPIQPTDENLYSK